MQPKPIEDEAIRNLLHELQIEPLTVDTQAATVSEPGNKENTRGDEVMNTVRKDNHNNNNACGYYQ